METPTSNRSRQASPSPWAKTPSHRRTSETDRDASASPRRGARIAPKVPNPPGAAAGRDPGSPSGRGSCRRLLHDAGSERAAESSNPSSPATARAGGHVQLTNSERPATVPHPPPEPPSSRPTSARPATARDRLGRASRRGMFVLAPDVRREVAGIKGNAEMGARVAAAVQKGLEKKRRPATARGRDAGLMRSGLLKRPSTASAAKASHPSWIIPSAHMEAAARFDMRHQCLSARGERVMKYEGTPRGNTIERRFDVGGDALSRFELTLAEIRWNRFFVREKLDDGGRAFATVPKKKKEEDSFDPMKTIWAPRASYCDAKDLYDTEDCELRMFQVDWEKARKTGGFEKILIKADDDGWVDEDGDGVADEVEEVERALRDHHNLIYQTFDFYASLGDSNDIFHIDYNAYQSFYQKCDIAIKGSKCCSSSHFDQLFHLVNAGANAGGVKKDKFNKDKALNRYEFLQLLVRIAIIRYVLTRQIPDVSDALHELFNQVLDQKLDNAVLQDSDIFRKKYCYIRSTTDVLTKYEPSLRVLYNMYAQADQGDGKGLNMGIANKKDKISYEEWQRLTRDLRLLDESFTPRLATLCFTWSKMRVIDESSLKGRAKLLHLSFEDFLEALVRMACMKGLPFDEEIAESECVDAGEFILELMCYPKLYEAFCRERASGWDEEPLQPVARCLEHLIQVIVRTVEGSTKGKDNMVLSETEAAEFFKRGGADDADTILKSLGGTRKTGMVRQKTVAITGWDHAPAPDTAAPAPAGRSPRGARSLVVRKLARPQGKEGASSMPGPVAGAPIRGGSLAFTDLV